MVNYTFHPSLKKALYLGIVQYGMTLLILLGLLILLSSEFLKLFDLFLFIGLCLLALIYVVYDLYTRGLVILTPQGHEGYSFKQLGSSNHFLSWDEIESVEPYRYFGLRFLLIRYYGSATPLWFPLFLKYQIQLNLLILECTFEDNPLHLALLQRGLFKRVPWYSRVQEYKSDRYLLESAYNEKIYNSCGRYCLNFLPLLILVLIPNLFIFNFHYDRYFYITTAVLALFLSLVILCLWQFGAKDSYLAIKDEGVEINLKFAGNQNKSFISWLEIERVEHYGWGLFEELRFVLKEPIHGFKFITFGIYALNRTKLRRVVMNQTNLDNPLQQAIIKHF